MGAIKAIVLWIGRSVLNSLVRSSITPNQVTCTGFLLVLMNCGFYLWHRDSFALGVGLSLSYAFDSLDGTVARRQGTTSKFGSYLDAVIDRYQELAAFIVIAHVNGWWPLMFFVMTGALLTPYNKAAVAIEIPIDDKGWPELLDRPRRMWVLGASLILDGSIPVPAVFEGRFLCFGLVSLAFLTHITALLRFLRARRLLLVTDSIDKARVGAPPGGPPPPN